MSNKDLDWMKENVKIFLDQNINNNVKSILEEKGWKNVFTVYDLGYKGANDGKLLRLILEKKMILVTHDKRFYKMSLKYHNEMCILIKGIVKSSKSIVGITQNSFIHNFTKIKEYYSEEKK
jgi:predicted nuclease of predicted toxin-antitoxin system